MPRRRRSRRTLRRRRLIILAIFSPILIYLTAALVGSIVPVNRGWTEPAEGTTIYLADNGIHADIIMPVSSQGLDWRRYFPDGDFAGPTASARWIAFGAGERGVYLNTPRWRDLTLGTALRALVGGERIMHVEYVGSPAYAERRIRLRPEEYRRLWAAIRADFALDQKGRPQHIDHPGYGASDAFYQGIGKTSAVRTCNSWAAGKLRLAGVKASLWPPFTHGLLWRYERSSGATSAR